jgi:hypothetical protein
MTLAALLLTILLFAAVVGPAVERGGVGELVGVVAIFIAILLAERWARSR